MDYHFQKLTAFNNEELARLSVNYLLHQRLNLGEINHIKIDLKLVEQASKNNSIVKLVDEILAFIHTENQQPNFKFFHWILSNATPQIIVYLQNHLPEQFADDWKVNLFLNLTKKLQPKQLIPLDFLNPDIQSLATTKKQNCLICFTGIGFKMMMPNQLFNHFALAHFDAVIYLKDGNKMRFCGGLGQGIKTIEDIKERLQEMTKGYQSVSVMGVSTGAIIAAQMAQKMSLSRCLLLSPMYEFKQFQAVLNKEYFNQHKLKIFFSSSNDLDNSLMLQWQQFVDNECINLVRCDTHNSAMQLLKNQQFDAEIKWMK
ncbi:MAG: hypothetical protein ISR69_00635 [Gammaproteobacteria bacterium]|nr:hypothetical protein [Gammaproteobacteria bacterium]